MKRMTDSKYIVLIFLLAAFICTGSHAQVSVTCPPGPNQFTAQVTAKVTFDQASQLYTYTYLVANDAKSAQEIDSLNLDFAPPVSNIINPDGWTDGIFGFRSTMSWAATVPAPLPPGAVDDGSVPPGFAQIKPGHSLGGFSLQSPKPPGPVKYFLSGFVNIPPQKGKEGSSDEDGEAAAEELLEQCPQSVGPLLDLAVVGTTQGPVDFIPVDIQIKPTATPPVPINPGAMGVTPVAVLGSASFDVTTVDQSSVRFGTGNAAPQKNSGHFEDVNHDGVVDLVFQFPSQSIGARCNDRALFLTGKNKAGTGIQGSEAIRTVGCKF